jgi:hypothetical protein
MFLLHLNLIGLYHRLNGNTNLKYKLLCFLTPNKKISKRKALAFNWDRCCHLALCLWLILFQCTKLMCIKPISFSEKDNNALVPGLLHGLRLHGSVSSQLPKHSPSIWQVRNLKEPMRGN